MRAVTFGEILWDDFGHRQVIGGAPFNLAAHMNRVGLPTGIITAVGEDALGRSTLDVVDAFGIDRRFVKTDTHPTGVCRVSKNEAGFPVYDLVQDVAYDHITVDERDLADLGRCDLFCFGTLAQRSRVSRDTLKKVLSSVDFPHIFCDLNIRQQYYDVDSVTICLKSADILKVSREEVSVLKELCICDHTDLAEICADLAQRFSIDLILITLDQDGALVYEKSEDRVLRSSIPKSKAVSTVGAGDSFSAAFLAHYMQGEPLEDCLEYAVALSDYVVTQLGAVPEYTPELLNKICIK